MSTRAEQPFGIIVDALSAGGSPPAPYPQPPGVEPRLLRQLGFILLRAPQPYRVRQGPLDAGSSGLRSPVRSNSAVLVRSLQVSLTCQRAFPLLERPALSARLFSLAPVWAWLATVRFAAFVSLRVLARLAEFPPRCCARFCTFDPFLRLAMIRPRSLVCCSTTHDAGSKDNRPSPSSPSNGLSTGIFGGSTTE